MKFYEVQPALEAGKRIRLPYMKGFLILDERFDAQPKIRYITNGCSTNHCISENELLADDWEILEENTIDSKLLSHKKYLEEWKAEIEEIMSRKEGEEIMSRKEGTDVSMRSIKYQELYLWSIRVGVIDECLEHIKEIMGQ